MEIHPFFLGMAADEFPKYGNEVKNKDITNRVKILTINRLNKTLSCIKFA